MQDLEKIIYSEDLSIGFLIEIALRTAIMFLVLIVALKLLSKRGVKQLSVFELAILIALGSATGDPMFYEDVPVLHGIAVIIVVILFYKLITRFTAKSKTIESLLEGEPTCLVENGKIIYDNYKRIGLPYDKFFAELRLKSVDHLGQVRKAYLETSGEISIYFFDDHEVLPGLPVYPELINHPLELSEEKSCACIYCGNVQYVGPGKDTCQVCANSNWQSSLDIKRIT
jgi:uncharacterized membrane protein YcaP (DUF421 family)